MIYLRIKEILKEQNKSKYWFVKNMEGSYQALTHLMNNETTSIKFSTLEKVCTILNCTPNELIEIKK